MSKIDQLRIQLEYKVTSLNQSIRESKTPAEEAQLTLRRQTIQDVIDAIRKIV